MLSSAESTNSLAQFSPLYTTYGFVLQHNYVAHDVVSELKFAHLLLVIKCCFSSGQFLDEIHKLQINSRKEWHKIAHSSNLIAASTSVSCILGSVTLSESSFAADASPLSLESWFSNSSTHFCSVVGANSSALSRKDNRRKSQGKKRWINHCSASAGCSF